MFILFPQILNFLEGPYRDVTAGRNGCPARRLRSHRHRPARAVPRAAEGRRLRRPRARDPVVMWQIWRFVVPGAEPERAALRDPVHHRGRRAVRRRLRRGVVHGRARRSSSCSSDRSAAQIQPFIDGRQVPDAHHADVHRVRRRVRVPACCSCSCCSPGVVNTRQLRHSRRWAVLGIVVFAAVITPSQDPFSLLFMAVPLYIFYEAAILIGRVLKR